MTRHAADVKHVKLALFADGAISARRRREALLYGNYQRGWNASSTNQSAWPRLPCCKIINLDHKGSLQRIAILPGPIKRNMHAIVNLKIPHWDKRVTLDRKGQDLAACPPRPGTSRCHAESGHRANIWTPSSGAFDSIKSRHTCVLWCVPKLLP